MATNDHRPLTAPDRAMWKDAAVAALASYIRRRGTQRSAAKHAALAATAADALLAEYRNRRITWRP